MYFDTDPAQHFVQSGKKAVPIHRVDRKAWKKGVDGLSSVDLAWAKANGFSAAAGETCLIPATNGTISAVLFGAGDLSSESSPTPKDRLGHARLARTLPKGNYILAGENPTTEDQLCWAMGGYSFDRYRKRKHATPKLVLPSGQQGQAVRRLAQGVFIARDLINTPASDLGPDNLEVAVRKLAKHHGARVATVKGDALLTKNFPMVHAVGRASAEAPRVIDLKWGKSTDPKVTLVGKGVTFDTGGLNIKPGASMSLMKKDMGGAANVLGLAHMIMDANLPVRLRVIIGAVENAIAGNAFRPGDVLQSRKGITVEIGNTDAEGRLVLGDCLTLGDEEKPEVMVDMATLTGAARVAVGPDLAPFYTDNESLAHDIGAQSVARLDPAWRMPLWDPYQSMLASKVADVNHITAGGFAGSITAALFLSRFVEQTKCWAHFDIFGWVPSDKPWAVTGGEACGIRALFAVLSKRYPT